VGLTRPWPVWLISAAAVAGALRFARPKWAKPHLLWLLALPGALLTLIHALTPEFQPDATTYHLGIVADWARTGAFSQRIGFYEILPLGLETLFLPAYFAAGPIGAKLVHFAFFVASLPLIARIGQQCGVDRQRAVLAAVFYSWTPVVMVTASAAYSDAALVFFTLACISAMLAGQDGAAGLSAGFCYAVKLTGGLVAVAGLVWLALRREWRRALWFAGAATVSSLPWIVRAWRMTGNPIAPVGNGIFPNDAFHAYTEQVLSTYLGSYGNLTIADIVRSLLWGGESLQGLLGPVCILLPLSLLALRRPETRMLALAALVLALPWTRNIGTRFLMPALPFALLAIASVLPRGVFAAATILHALLALPPVMDRYTDAGAWRLRGAPWQVALRLQDPEDYLTRNLWEYRFCKTISKFVKPGEVLLDLYALPYAYLPVVPLGPLSSAEFDNIVYTLNSATGQAPDNVFQLKCRWPMEFTRELRLIATGAWPAPLAVAEMRPLRDGAPVRVLRNWFLDAWPNAGDSPLAIDNNQATRWSTLESVRGGEWWALRFDRPVPTDGVILNVVNADKTLKFHVTVTGIDGAAHQACAERSSTLMGQVFNRKSAIAYAKSRGVRWIVGRLNGGGHAQIARALHMVPEAFGVRPVARFEDLVLFQVL
jgi:hypothetical protein